MQTQQTTHPALFLVIERHTFSPVDIMKATQDKKGLLKVHTIACWEHMPTWFACVQIKMESGFLRSLFFIEMDTMLDKRQLQLLRSAILAQFLKQQSSFKKHLSVSIRNSRIDSLSFHSSRLREYLNILSVFICLLVHGRYISITTYYVDEHFILSNCKTPGLQCQICA